MPSGWRRHKKRPVHAARASGLNMASTVCPATSAGTAASAHLEGLHHSMRQVWLAIFVVGEVTDKPILTGGKVSAEGAPRSLVQQGYSPKWLGRRWALHAGFAPGGEVFHLFSGGQPQQNQLVGLRSRVLHQNCLLAGLERLGGLEVVVYQLDGDVRGGLLRRRGR